MTDEKCAMLRHTVATVAYRGGKAVRDAPDGFSVFRAKHDVRTPLQILAHMGDLFDWALTLAQGRESWHNSEPLPWDREVDRFFAALKAFDEFLAGDRPLAASAEKLFQGPVADALTHIGQIAILRRIVEAPVRGENYYRADITAGRVGTQQSAPRREFD